LNLRHAQLPKDEPRKLERFAGQTARLRIDIRIRRFVREADADDAGRTNPLQGVALAGATAVQLAGPRPQPHPEQDGCGQGDRSSEQLAGARARHDSPAFVLIGYLYICNPPDAQTKEPPTG